MQQALEDIRKEQEQGKKPQDGQKPNATGQGAASSTQPQGQQQSQGQGGNSERQEEQSKKEDISQKQAGNNSADKSGKESNKGEPDNGDKNSKQQAPESQPPKDKTDTDPSKGQSQDKGSSQPDHNAALKPFPDGEGPGSDGLGGKKGFQDVEIKPPDEKFDTRFTGQNGTLSKNDKSAETKTDLADVKLAKPEPLKDTAKQPIPLEYEDILR